MTVLAGGPQHGYGVLREVGELSEGRMAPAIGSLYRILDALHRDGLVEESGSEVVDGRFRRYYRLTPAGRADLVSATDTMDLVVAHSRRRLSNNAPGLATS